MRWSWKRWSCSRGVSLVELLICCGLLAIVMLGVYVLFVQGLRHYEVTTALLDTQVGGLVSLSRLSEELSEANSATVRTEPEGVVFASPRDAAGSYRYQGTSILWQRYICYYLEAGRLLRKEELLATPTAVPPDPAGQGKTVAYFRALPQPARTVNWGVRELTLSGAAPVDIRAVFSRRLNLPTARPEDKLVEVEFQTQAYPRN